MASNFNQPNFSQGRPRIQGDSSARPLIPNNALLDVPSTPRPVQGSAMADTISAAATQPQVNSAAVQPQGQQQAPVQQVAPNVQLYQQQSGAPAWSAVGQGLGGTGVETGPDQSSPSSPQAQSYIDQGYADFGQGGPTPYGTKPGEIFLQEAQGMAPATYTQSPFDVDPATKARQNIEDSVNRQIADQQAQANRRAAAVGLQGGIAAQGAQAIATSGAEALAGQLSKFDLEQQALADQKAFQQWQQDFQETQNEQGAEMRNLQEEALRREIEYARLEFVSKFGNDAQEYWGFTDDDLLNWQQMVGVGGMDPMKAVDSIRSSHGGGEGNPTGVQTSPTGLEYYDE